jgi:hypothetical protein
MTTGPLALLAFPQEWQADKIMRIRFLCLPKGDPFQPLATGQAAFVDAKLKFEARLNAGLAGPPQYAGSEKISLEVAEPAEKRKLFEALADQIGINPRAPRKRADTPIFRKAATETYREVTGDRRLSEYMVSEKDYECALHTSHNNQPEGPSNPEEQFRWGQIIAFVVRQPALATAMGLIGEARFSPPSGFFDDGGWLHVGLRSGDALPEGLAVSHAALIPALIGKRDIFTSVLFPLDARIPIDLLREAQQYDLGRAQLVHGRQTFGGADGDAIQLSWDDEQVTEWLNRQVSGANSFPMGTAGYRVDVRSTNGPGQWNSLQKIQSIRELKLGEVNLKKYAGEGIVEVLPVQLPEDNATPAADRREFWMPPYFSTWRGASLVLTDLDLKKFHRDNSIAFEDDSTDPQPNREKVFEPVDDKKVSLRYGQNYDFRVRLADLTGGGPGEGAKDPADVDADDHPIASVNFRRSKPPGPVTVINRPTRARTQLVVERPRLTHPEILYTSPGYQFNQLDKRDLGLPDPDVSLLLVSVQVRALAADRASWFEIYKTERAFDSGGPLPLAVRFIDRPTLIGFPKATKTGALPLPTARDVRIVLTAVGRDDKSYWKDDVNVDVRKGPPVTVELHAVAQNEPALGSKPELTSFFLRQPPPGGSVSRPAERLAAELKLDHHDVTLAGRARERTVLGCSALIRHTLSPERSAITLSADTDATNQWIHALRFRIVRDWTWRGLAEDGIEIYRQVQRGNRPIEAEQLVGTVSLPTALSQNATTDTDKSIREDRRQTTEVVFFDALDPKPEAGKHPTELFVRYTVKSRFESGVAGIPLQSGMIRLPVTTPPSQVPKLLSAGIAFRDVALDKIGDKPAPRAALWVEFAERPSDPGDAFFVRPLVAAPDPVLTDVPIPQMPEPLLPIDPEWMRLIHVGQPSDSSGALAMQPLSRRAEDGQCYLVPLPDGVDETSPDLFSMYTYEIRVGHADERWCTANGRWGSPLRVTGVKHPPPQLYCQAARTETEVVVRAPFATPTLLGRPVRPRLPKTRLWALLYARVRQADNRESRHLLLANAPLRSIDAEDRVVSSADAPVFYGRGAFSIGTVEDRLEVAGLPPDADLAVLAVEFYTEPEVRDPLGENLGHAPFMRTSELVPVPDAC